MMPKRVDSFQRHVSFALVCLAYGKLSSGRPRSSWTLVGYALCLAAVLHARPALAQFGLPFHEPAARDTRQDAIRSIPLDRISAEAREKILSVVENPTIYRRLPTKSIECDHELYLFLIRNPEVVVNMWQLMGITSVQCKRIGPYTHEGSDGAGTLAEMDLVYGSKETHVFYADGYHEGPVLKRHINGKCVLVLKSGYDSKGETGNRVTSRLDFFLQLENAGADFVARSIHPLVGKTADNNFSESLNFVGQMSRAAAQKGDGVNLLAKRLQNVEPEVRDQFINVTMNVYQRAALRRMAAGEAHANAAHANIGPANTGPANTGSRSASSSQAGDELESVLNSEPKPAKSNLRLRR